MTAETVFSRGAHEQMHLSVFMGGGSNYHSAGWRHPDAVDDAGSNLDRWIEFVRLLEAAKFDMMFIADSDTIAGLDDTDALALSSEIERFEPLTLLSALAMVTRRLGLVATAATTFDQPYAIARSFASLDLLSGGRAGWNVVTGGHPDAALNFSLSGYVPSAERYARGSEFVDVVAALWASMEPDAILRDKATGRYVDPSRLHKINFSGKYYSCRGPLNVMPSPQGRPILVQAGQSEDGRALASRIADVVFTAQSSLEGAKAFSTDIRTRMARFGRDPFDVKILPGVFVTVAPTREEARAKARALDDLVNIDRAMSRLREYLPGIDLSPYDLDAPFPELQSNDMRVSTPRILTQLARQHDLTLREVAIRNAVSKSHNAIVGTPQDVADELEAWFRCGAADGFNLLPGMVPGSITDFIDLVIPELRRRGLFREEYEGATLREHLGVPLRDIPPADRAAGDEA